MLEKIMKTVKSNNKKRGRNITIGTVVGMLLSCTVVMGASEHLWIKEDSGIKFSADNGVTPASSVNPYGNKNIWNESTKTYVNNMALLGIDNDSGLGGYGLKLSGNLGEFKFINNDSITGTFTKNLGFGFCSGIYNQGTIAELANNGLIAGVSTINTALGISNDGAITKLTNTSSIIGRSTESLGAGIANYGTIAELTNNGLIKGVSEDSPSYGVSNDDTITKLANTGLITGTSEGGPGSGVSNVGTIIELTNTGSIIGSTTANRGYGVSNKGIIAELINTGSIVGEAASFGLGISNTDTITELANTGSIIGSTTANRGYGVSNKGIIAELINTGSIVGEAASFGLGISNTDTITELANTGSIIGMARGSSGYGIYNTGTIEKPSTIKKLINNGSLTGISAGSFGLGISNTDTITELINNGSIIGTAAGNSGYGISNTGAIEKLINNGLIIGTAAGSFGYGIYNTKSIETLINTGVIHGSHSAIRNSGTVTNLINYGILVTDGDASIGGNGTISTENHYGLQIINADTSPTVTPPSTPLTNPVDIIVGYDEGNPLTRNMTVKNNQTTDESGSFTGNDYSNSILNALKNTYEVTGTDNKVEGSIINAYGTAVLFTGSDNQLTLSGTIVSGGIDGSSAVIGSSNGDTLTLQSGTVVYKGGSTGTQNTVINGNIDMGIGDDTLAIGTGTIITGNVDMGDNNDTITVETGSILNGTLNGGDGNDILNFNPAVTRASGNNGINILHNISDFENININTNVTLFEKTVKDDGTLTNLTITGAEEINIGANGVLTLRIDSTNGANTHALSTNTGIISSSDGGKLLLALNGAGNNSIISFGGTQLGDSIKGTEIGLNYQEEFTIDTTSFLHSVEKIDNSNVKIVAQSNLPLFNSIPEYDKLNETYKGIISVDELSNFYVTADESFSSFLDYLNDIYAGNPHSYSSELSRKSAGMFRDIVTENQFKPNLNNWLIYGGLTHTDGGTKDTYYGKGYYTYDIGSSNIDADTKITGAYMLGEYGVTETLTSGVIIGGNKLKSDLSNGSKVDGDALYLGVYAKKYLGNLKVTGGLGFQYGDYDTDRLAVNKVASSTGESITKYSSNYNDMTYDIYLNGRYSHQVGDNLFLEPYGTLSYTYTKQDGADEGNKTLAMEINSKSFDYTVGKIGVDLKKVIPHSNGKSTLSAGISYTKILDGAEEETITGRFKGGSDFDILVTHKNQHSIGLNAKYALELESGLLFDIKGTYSVERDSHNGSGKNRAKGEWIVGTGVGYKF